MKNIARLKVVFLWTLIGMVGDVVATTDKDVLPRPAISMKVKADHALFNHVLLTETDVKDSPQCMIMCALKNTCQSFNYSDKEKVCELNGSTKQKHLQDFLPRVGYHYFMKGKGVVNKRFAGDL